MLSKKKPTADIEKRRSTFLLIGLVIVLSLIYIGFELLASTDSKEPTQMPEDDFIVFYDQTQNTDKKIERPKVEPFKEQILKTIKTNIDIKSTFINGIDIPFDPYTLDTSNIIIIPPEPEDFKIRSFAQKMPQYPGGEAAFKKFLQNELVYPEESRKLGIEGVVLVQFVVERDGRVSHPKILVSVYPELDQEAIRVISKSPKWIPGENFGNKVRISFQMPIHFKID